MKKQPIVVAQIMGKWVGGGVEAVIMNYYRNIDRTKIQFDFICDSDSTNIPYDEIKKLGGKVILIPPYQNVISYHFALKKVLKKGKYNIVHSHINTLSVFSLFAAWCARVPIRIAHNHATSSKREWKRNILKNILKPLNKIFANVYMACSKNAGIWMFGEKEYSNGNVKIINNAIETKKFIFDIKERTKLRKKYNIADDEIVIGQVGRLMQTKNQSFSIEIFKDFIKEKKSKLIFVGSGPMEKELKEKVTENNIDNDVIFLGQMDNTHSLYSMFDILILPSFYEGFGMVLLEAQVSNLTCIVSTGIPIEAKIVDNVKFISLDDKREWISELNNFKFVERVDNSNYVKNMNFDIELECQKLEKIYDKLLRGDIDA